MKADEYDLAMRRAEAKIAAHQRGEHADVGQAVPGCFPCRRVAQVAKATRAWAPGPFGDRTVEVEENR